MQYTLSRLFSQREKFFFLEPSFLFAQIENQYKNKGQQLCRYNPYDLQMIASPARHNVNYIDNGIVKKVVGHARPQRAGHPV